MTMKNLAQELEKKNPFIFEIDNDWFCIAYGKVKEFQDTGRNDIFRDYRNHVSAVKEYDENDNNQLTKLLEKSFNNMLSLSKALFDRTSCDNNWKPLKSFIEELNGEQKRQLEDQLNDYILASKTRTR